MPSESNAFVYNLCELLVGAMGVGVSHVIQHSNCERAISAGRAGCLEAQDLRGSSSIGGGNLVIVFGICLEIVELHIVKELAALGDDNGRARRRTTVGNCLSGAARAKV